MILTIPNPILRTKVQGVSDYPRKTVKALWEHLLDSDILGLAAPQIGISDRIILYRGIPFINPIIIDRSDQMAAGREGCKSIPNTLFFVDRPREITVKWTTYALQEKIEHFIGLEARILQHEIDHLDGILIDEKGDYTNSLDSENEYDR